MSFITKKHLSRRTFIRGMGVGLSLPLLESMVPAQTPLARTAANPQIRLGLCFMPHGAVMAKWTPDEEGALKLSPILMPLEPYKNRVVVISNLAHKMAGPQGPGDNGGDHTRCPAVYLNGVHPKRTDGADIQAGTTIDQIAAQKIGQNTLLPSLELAIEDYSGLFGDGATAEERLRRIETQRSILDAVTGQIRRLQGGLGAGDRNRVAEYLDTVREIERRIQVSEKSSSSNLDVPVSPSGIPDDWEEHMKLMFDLMALAFQADITRISTFMMAREVSYRTFSKIGISEAFHPASHHQNNPARLEALTKIQTYHVTFLAYLLERLKNTPDGDGSLLDHSLVLYGGAMSNSNVHNHAPLPILVAGGATGRMKGGRHLKYPEDTPMANLLMTILDKAGIPQESVGDSTGFLSEV